MNKTGISALVSIGGWFEDTFSGTVLSIGKPAHAECDCEMEMTGANLAYVIVINNGHFVSVYGHCMDAVEQPQFLLTVKDDKDGWQIVTFLIGKLETSGLKDLSKRPIELGDTGPNGIVIE